MGRGVRECRAVRGGSERWGAASSLRWLEASVQRGACKSCKCQSEKAVQRKHVTEDSGREKKRGGEEYRVPGWPSG
eukprot:2244818-Rhodomonas_salina.1